MGFCNDSAAITLCGWLVWEHQLTVLLVWSRLFYSVGDSDHHSKEVMVCPWHNVSFVFPGFSIDSESLQHATTGSPCQGDWEDILFESLCPLPLQCVQGSHGENPALCGHPLRQWISQFLVLCVSFIQSTYSPLMHFRETVTLQYFQQIWVRL